MGMPLDEFNARIRRLVEGLGLDEETAADYVAGIGDLPLESEDGTRVWAADSRLPEGGVWLPTAVLYGR